MRVYIFALLNALAFIHTVAHPAEPGVSSASDAAVSVPEHAPPDIKNALQQEAENPEPNLASGAPPGLIPDLRPGREDSLSKIRNRYRRAVIKKLFRSKDNAKCNFETVRVRREWGSMSPNNRREYTKAVKCLYNRPSISDPKVAPGARNRLDDFVVAHLQNLNTIHFNGHFYAWHRHFVWLYERALREECGYDGPTPYWDWTRYYKDPANSPVFDGSDTSMGGNGEVVSHGYTVIDVFGKQLTLPPGTGGGCVKDGPFGDLTVNLGITRDINNPAPAQLRTAQSGPESTEANVAAAFLEKVDSPTALEASSNNSDTSPPSDSDTIRKSLQYNPRCLTRDINPEWASLSTPPTLRHLLNCDSIVCLEQRSDGWEIGASNASHYANNLHGAGHFTIGGLNNDPFVSPGDPIFFLHHGMVDRIWALWQGQKSSRVTEIGGRIEPFDVDSTSALVTAGDEMDFGVNGNKVRLGDVGDTLSGPYCYFYV